MSSDPDARSVSLDGRGRLIALLIAACLVSVMTVAAWLRPASEGLGTHQQLGLPPCTMRVIYGIRCPACGMTTSWAYFVRGRWISSITTNAGGFVLAIVAVAVIGVSGFCGLTGRGSGERPIQWLAVALVAAMVVALADWVTRIT